MTTQQPEALRLADALTRAVEQEAPDDDTIVVARWFVEDAAAELRRLHESNQELVEALRVAALAIHEYRTQGAPHAYWDDVEYQAAEAINKAERTTL